MPRVSGLSACRRENAVPVSGQPSPGPGRGTQGRCPRTPGEFSALDQLHGRMRKQEQRANFKNQKCGSHPQRATALRGGVPRFRYFDICSLPFDFPYEPRETVRVPTLRAPDAFPRSWAPRAPMLYPRVGPCSRRRKHGGRLAPVATPPSVSCHTMWAGSEPALTDMQRAAWAYGLSLAHRALSSRVITGIIRVYLKPMEATGLWQN